uniref:Uncharacterized protein n=1 Tax=Myoviridae sp. ctuIn11 TaxID=2827715 RepID=A0A8S5SHV5_9CAUD|nr:MAG TPA: hypothetical protein [Myoviridae sp. ctuIn11]
MIHKPVKLPFVHVLLVPFSLSFVPWTLRAYRILAQYVKDEFHICSLAQVQSRLFVRIVGVLTNVTLLGKI